MHQTPFQSRLWDIAKVAHAAGDRADSRILMKMVDTIDSGDYGALQALAAAVRAFYRERLGAVPAARQSDCGTASPSAARSTSAEQG